MISGEGGFMSETVRLLIETLSMIGAISGLFIWYGIVAGKRAS
jgi:hypothetical protein